MHRRFWALCVPLALLASTRIAYAQDAPAVGHFPVLAVMATFNTSFVPIQFRSVNFGGSLGALESESIQDFGVGPELRLRIDLDKVLLYGDGYYNFLSSGVAFDVHAGVVFGALAGGRSTATLTTFRGSTYTSTERIDHYESHTGKTLPVVYGLLLGANTTQVRDAVREAIGIQPEHRREGSLLTSIEAGFGLMSAQFELIAALQFEVTHLLPGLRWRIQYAFPIGPLPLYFHISGQHLFGSAEDNPMSTSLSTGIGLGSGMGVSP